MRHILKKNNPITSEKDVIITIKRLGINGEGIGYYKKKIIFIPNALPGEVVVAKITETFPKYLEGELIRIKEKSPHRVAFPKNVNPETGGLELAHLDYDSQLLFKKELIKDSLLKFHPRNYQKIKIKNTIPAPKQWYYRNKAQYQIESIKNKISLGMYAPKSQKIIDLPIMPTQSKNTQKIEFAIKKLIEKMHIAIADSRYKKDGIKTVVVRQSHATDEIQVTLVTIGKNIKNLDKLAEKIIELENVVSVFQNESQWNNPLVWGNKTTKLIGKNYITEQILNKKFILSPRAFFQLNPEQTEVLYSTALNYLELNANSVLVDAYAGVGTLGILASEKVKQVIGIESIPEAIADAQFNCRLNNVKNAEYINGSVEKILPQMQKDGIAIDALIVDPPRTGLNKQLVKTLLTCKPKDFVYISCNPSTLARDLVLLSQAYDVRLIQPVDMMPQTPRWEGIAKLVLRK